MTRLTDDEKRLGPLRWGTTTWRAWRFVLESHGGDEGYQWNQLTVYLLGFVASLSLPRIIRLWRQKVHVTTWDAATVARLGRDWYWNEEPREYGFGLSDGHLCVYFGIQPGDSSRDQYWSCFLPWTQWRFVRFSLYQPDGAHFFTELEGKQRKTSGLDHYKAQHEAEKAVGKVVFKIRDFDGAFIDATCHIEEREWLFGTKWCSWLSWFTKPKISRSLSINFSAEVGPEKGSWKGGTLGHGIDMLPGETPHQAFKRYCDQEHRSKHRKFRIELQEASLA